VLDTGVDRMAVRASQSECPSLDIFAMTFFTVSTNRSAKPFDLGCSGLEVTRRTPFLLQKARNSALANCGPLSVFSSSGTPKSAKIRSSSAMQAALVSILRGTAQGHLL
jgi:hypothetical protein